MVRYKTVDTPGFRIVCFLTNHFCIQCRNNGFYQHCHFLQLFFRDIEGKGQNTTSSYLFVTFKTVFFQPRVIERSANLAQWGTEVRWAVPLELPEPASQGCTLHFHFGRYLCHYQSSVVMMKEAWSKTKISCCLRLFNRNRGMKHLEK